MLSENYHILICAGGANTNILLRKLIEPAGFDVDTAIHFKTACDLLGRNIYDAIIIDLDMHDGAENDFAQTVKTDPAYWDIPIITFSAQQGQLPGAESFMAGLQDAINRRYAVQPFILHIEDDEDLSHVITTALRDHAYVVSAGSLREAKAYLKLRHFDLIILDLALPDGNGLDLLQHMPQLTDQIPPILILTASAVNPPLHKCIKEIIVKSRISEQKMIEKIISYLPLKTAQPFNSNVP